MNYSHKMLFSLLYRKLYLVAHNFLPFFQYFHAPWIVKTDNVQLVFFLSTLVI